MLTSVEAVIDAIGGASAACDLAGVKSISAPSNWKTRKRIPPEHFLVFSDALRAVGKEADPAVFGLRPAEERT